MKKIDVTNPRGAEAFFFSISYSGRRSAADRRRRLQTKQRASMEVLLSRQRSSIDANRSTKRKARSG